MKIKSAIGICTIVFFVCLAIPATEPEKDNGEFIEYRNTFDELLEKTVGEEKETKKEPEKRFKMDGKGKDVPSSLDEFTQIWHNPTHPQGLTGACWSFSSTSFFESEIHRLSGKKIKLSVMYPVYWEYVEKARRFVKHRGDSRFSRGSQPNALVRMWKKYGVVPAEFYEGKKPGQKYYHDKTMFAEMKSYLESVKESSAWNEKEIIETIRSIMNHYMGAPPEKISIDGTLMTPKEYLKNVLKINLDDYVDVMSLKAKTWYKKAEYEVADNWWHSGDYFNVPLKDFMKIIKNAVRKGYTVCIVGDNSETGFLPEKDVAMIPAYDIPPEYIDDNARQFRFSNDSTSDDHAIHIVGFLEKDGKDWYLIKDSGSKSRNGKVAGYFFYHVDFVKLKMMNFMVHRDMVEETIRRKISED